MIDNTEVLSVEQQQVRDLATQLGIKEPRKITAAFYKTAFQRSLALLFQAAVKGDEQGGADALDVAKTAYSNWKRAVAKQNEVRDRTDSIYDVG